MTRFCFTFSIGRYDLLLAPLWGAVNVSRLFMAFARTNGSATQALAPPVSFKQRIKTCATSATLRSWRTPCALPSP
jgi:hypothetical protein